MVTWNVDQSGLVGHQSPPAARCGPPPVCAVQVPEGIPWLCVVTCKVCGCGSSVPSMATVQVVAACGSRTVPRSSPASPRCGPRWSRSPRCPRMCTVRLWRISWQSNRSTRKAVPRMVSLDVEWISPGASSAVAGWHCGCFWSSAWLAGRRGSRGPWRGCCGPVVWRRMRHLLPEDIPQMERSPRESAGLSDGGCAGPRGDIAGGCGVADLVARVAACGVPSMGWHCSMEPVPPR